MSDTVSDYIGLPLPIVCLTDTDTIAAVIIVSFVLPATLQFANLKSQGIHFDIGFLFQIMLLFNNTLKLLYNKTLWGENTLY